MACEEVIVSDRDVRSWGRISGPDSYIVISVGDPGPRNGEVLCVAGIDAVSIARTGRRNDLDVPRGEVAGGACGGNVKERRISDRDLVQRNVAGAAIYLNGAWILL